MGYSKFCAELAALKGDLNAVRNCEVDEFINAITIEPICHIVTMRELR